MTVPAADEVERLRAMLEQARQERRTLTYREVADALRVEAPHRIHRVTALVEGLFEADAAAGRPSAAALVVSRVRNGRPAPGFFEHARRLGLYRGDDPDAFHDALLAGLFEQTPAS
ncbi:hypothetical protein [Halomonas denitrificans]|nr:hypothetical protein [Halomonas denitrificans]